MAAFHVRSNSFPSTKHPLNSEFDEQLSRLRSSQEVSSSSKLNTLQDLHDCVDQLLLLPLNQQALSKLEYSNEKLVDEVLEGSLRLFDFCDIAKYALTQTKESTQELLSILRRRRGSDLSIEVKRFLASKKLAKKALQKVSENRANYYLSHKKQENFKEILSVLREVESITLAVFESMFSFISKSSQKSSSWSLVSKLVKSKRSVVCDEVNEFKSVEAELKSLIISQKAKKSDKEIEERAQNELQRLEICVKDLEEGVESLYRRLIKTRVTLLNILNHYL